jgi:DNA-binding response OmpR family regulator
MLIVEDDWTTHDALRRIFIRKGWEVLSALTVAGGLALLDPPPDCLILDLMLPDGEGEEVLRKIRDDRLGTRVAVCTAMSDPSRLAVVEGMDPEALLRKPIDLAKVYRVFEEMMPG